MKRTLGKIMAQYAIGMPFIDMTEGCKGLRKVTKRRKKELAGLYEKFSKRHERSKLTKKRKTSK